MAVVRRTISERVCDMPGCGSTDRVHNYAIIVDGAGRTSVDLCRRHAQPVEDVRQAGVKARSPIGGTRLVSRESLGRRKR